MMTPRERVLTAIRHKEPDMVPIDLGGMDSCCGIHCLTLKKLLKYLKLDGPVRIYEPIELLGEVPEALIREFGVDVVSIQRTTKPTGLSSKDITFKEYYLMGEKFQIPQEVDIVKENENEYMRAWFSKDVKKKNIIVAIRKPATPFFEPYPFYTPLKDVTSASEITELPPHPWITEYTDKKLEILRKNAKWLYENTDYAIYGHAIASMFEITIYLLGHTTFAKCLRNNKRIIEKLVELLLEHNKEELKKFLDAVGEYIQIVGFGGEDLGTQTGPVINPKEWRELYKPALKEITDIIRNRTNCHILIHSCGSIRPFIEDFIEIGVDILNPVQISAKDMDPHELKREFGDQITFWGGGCDTQHILPFASPEKIKQHVKEVVTIFKEGGGYVFAPVHNIQPKVPPENVVAMYEAVKEIREY